MLETPQGFPGLEDVAKGDTKKFLVEVKCTDKEDTGEMEWEVLSIDGVKLPEDSDEEAEEEFSEYDDSEDEGASEDFDSSGKPKSTKGIGMLIVGGEPK